jgi:hypothetical protein
MKKILIANALAILTLSQSASAIANAVVEKESVRMRPGAMLVDQCQSENFKLTMFRDPFGLGYYIEINGVLVEAKGNLGNVTSYADDRIAVRNNYDSTYSILINQAVTEICLSSKIQN